MLFFNKNWPRQFLASWLVLAFLTALILSNVLLQKKEAQAANATLGMQITQYILDKISWAKDYALQTLQKYYSQIISQIQQWLKWDILNQRALKDAWNQTRAQLLKQLTNDIIKWSQGESGKPNFVIDWADYLGEKTVQAGHEFIEQELGQGNMCLPFDQEVRDAVSKTSPSIRSRSNFQEQTRCPLTNYEDFINDFSQGGWNAWLEMFEPGGNLYGAYLISSDQKSFEESRAYTAEIFKLTAGQGFKGDGKTPGIVQSYATQRASMMDFDYLLESDELNEYVSSVIDAFINRIKNEGLELMQTDTYDYHQNQIPQVTVPEPVIDLNFVKSNHEYFLGISDYLALIEENLNNLLGEQNANLEVMNQIKEVQEHIKANCCTIATQSIDPEIDQLKTEISQTNSRISHADGASQDFKAVLTASDAAIAADNALDLAALNSALESFATAWSKARSSLQLLIGSNQTKPERLYMETGDYSMEIVTETTNYFERRGHPKLTKTYNDALQVSDTLYGQLKIEQNKLNECPCNSESCPSCY